MEQGGSQEEHYTLGGDLSRAQLEQQQAAANLAALKQTPAEGRCLTQRSRCRRTKIADGKQLRPEPSNAQHATLQSSRQGQG